MSDKNVGHDNVCEFCGKSFKTTYSLRVHIDTAKYCLKTRGQMVNNYKCEYCDHISTQKFALKLHHKTCIKFKDSIIETKNGEIATLTEKIETYEKTIKKIRADNANHKKTHQQYTDVIESLTKETENQKVKIAKLEETITFGKGYVEGCKTVKPSKITNNNNTHNTLVQKLGALPVTTIEPFTISLIKKNLENYTYEMYKRAELGVVDFITDITILEMEDGTIEKNYVSCDLSRNAFHRLIVGKKWTLDGGAKFLNVVLDQLSLKANEYYDELHKEINELGIRETMKNVLIKEEIDLQPFYYGVTRPKSKDRIALLPKIRSAIKNNNHIDVLSIDR